MPGGLHPWSYRSSGHGGACDVRPCEASTCRSVLPTEMRCFAATVSAASDLFFFVQQLLQLRSASLISGGVSASPPAGGRPADDTTRRGWPAPDGSPAAIAASRVILSSLMLL